MCRRGKDLAFVVFSRESQAQEVIDLREQLQASELHFSSPQLDSLSRLDY